MFCQNCGKEIAADSVRCNYCGYVIKQVIVSGDNFIPRNGYALSAYYCSIFSLFSCLPILGIVAVVLGIVAIIQGKKGVKYAIENNGEGIKHAIFGIVLGYISVISSILVHLLIIFAISYEMINQ